MTPILLLVIAALIVDEALAEWHSRRAHAGLLERIPLYINNWRF